MVDISKIVNQVELANLHKRRYSGFVYDVPSGFQYFCIRSDGRIWAAYCTYCRYEWDHNTRHKVIDTVILVNGSPDKGYKYQVSFVPNRIEHYKNRKVKDGYVWYKNNDIRDKYPEVCDTIDRVLMWMELRR
jgi:hypothetical protein